MSSRLSKELLPIVVAVFFVLTGSLNAAEVRLNSVIMCKSFFSGQTQMGGQKMKLDSSFKFKAKNGQDYLLEVIRPDRLSSYLKEIAAFRIKYFREFPYLYEGNFEYEHKYINGFASDSRALLTIVKKDTEIVGVSTALPLVSEADILGDAVKKFVEKGLNPKEYYYYGEVVIKPEHQGQGVAGALMKMQESFAKSLGFEKIALATVVRNTSDERMPKNYVSTDGVWRAAGFKKEDIYIDYEWPTILADNSIKSINNLMVFWTKDLR